MRGESIGFLMGIFSVVLCLLIYYIYIRDFTDHTVNKKKKNSKTKKYNSTAKVNKPVVKDFVKKCNTIIENPKESESTYSSISTIKSESVEIEEIPILVEFHDHNFLSNKDFQKNYIVNGENNILHKFKNVITIDSLYHSDIYDEIEKYASKYSYELICVENLIRSLLFYLKMHMKNFMEYFKLTKIREGPIYGPLNAELKSDDQIYQFFSENKMEVKNNALHINGEEIQPRQKVSIDILFDQISQKDYFVALITQILRNSIEQNKKYIISGINAGFKYFTGAPVKILYEDSFENRVENFQMKKQNMSENKIKKILTDLDEIYIEDFKRADETNFIKVTSGEDLEGRLVEILG